MVLGVGKSSLIRAIVQTCEDIVHADSLFLPSTSAVPRDSKSKSKSRKGMVHDSTTRITEVYASTRAYPSWWSELEEGKVLRRRRSSGVGDSILERNICFVDTPGWGKATSVGPQKYQSNYEY
jgi:predicted GTPase